jgi:hypothetical protein
LRALIGEHIGAHIGTVITDTARTVRMATAMERTSRIATRDTDTHHLGHIPGMDTRPDHPRIRTSRLGGHAETAVVGLGLPSGLTVAALVSIVILHAWYRVAHAAGHRTRPLLSSIPVSRLSPRNFHPVLVGRMFFMPSFVDGRTMRFIELGQSFCHAGVLMVFKIFRTLVSAASLFFILVFGAEADECQLAVATFNKYIMGSIKPIDVARIFATAGDQTAHQKDLCEQSRERLKIEKTILELGKKAERACGARWKRKCDSACAAANVKELEKKTAYECDFPTRAEDYRKKEREEQAKQTKYESDLQTCTEHVMEAKGMGDVRIRNGRSGSRAAT